MGLIFYEENFKGVQVKLKKFLKSKGVWNSFKENFNPTYGHFVSRKHFLKHVGNTCGITQAFGWNETIQGWDYWNELHGEYMKQLNRED